jgi:hypothetical protein
LIDGERGNCERRQQREDAEDEVPRVVEAH